MRLSRGLVAVVSGLLLAVSGCTSSDPGSPDSSAASTTPAAPEAEEIAWSDCDEQIQSVIAGTPGSERDILFECGSTQVPITYAEPQGEKLTIFLVRARLATQTDRIGSLVINPGGPGGSGADAAIQRALTMPENVLNRFDLVGFDPRGVGLSTPAVECVPDELKDRVLAAEPRPVSDEQLDDSFALAQEVVDGCTDEYGDALGTFNTTDTARDLDLLREGLGDEQLTFLGWSYGTTLGSTYAELFPDRVRALALDAAVDPDNDPQADAEASAAGLEAGFDAFAANCTSLVAGCPIGAEPRRFVDELLAQAAQAPIPSARAGETRQATPGVVLTAVQAGLYNTSAWPQLAQGLAAARNGDAQGLFSLADAYNGRLQDGTYSNLIDANLAVTCADRDPDTQLAEDEIRALAADWGQRYPLFGAGSAASLYTCSGWEAERTPLPARDAAGAAPILVVGNTGDPVTPLPGAEDMAADLTSAVLLVWQGLGHTSYPKTGCVNDVVNAYLVDLVVPADGATCPL
ncbi:alpha/beta hydrolase [Geodermatophilus sabuli]|uniref:Alpha/beta hydrolase fold n=1 Tax=Geodermatophilus sabuli TaxID=1564158 RepID=A0A285EAH9_9ACTN|nr:alpha/beta hydrolase [Geodermatophilus sabuli]MBB3085583.1 pimeloyl-ACP methyl ester carboxylesterase [Geodermatophilus sabuli]SNX95997.1 alpha/beta hydrolase fold [Geodermatophilus sabuli]